MTTVFCVFHVCSKHRCHLAVDPGLKPWTSFWFDSPLHTQYSLSRECIIVQIHPLYIPLNSPLQGLHPSHLGAICNFFFFFFCNVLILRWHWDKTLKALSTMMRSSTNTCSLLLPMRASIEATLAEIVLLKRPKTWADHASQLKSRKSATIIAAVQQWLG